MVHRTQLLLAEADAYRKTGRWQAAVEICESIFEASWRNGDAADLCEALIRLGLLYSGRNERVVSEEYFVTAFEIAQRRGDLRRAARASNGLGISHQNAGDIGSAEIAYHTAMDLAVAAGDRATTGDIQLNLGIIANIRGELDEALDRYTKSLTAYEDAGNHQRVASVLNNMAMAYVDLADYSQAGEALQRGLNICRLNGDVDLEGILLANKAELHVTAGDYAAAKDVCDTAIQVAARLDSSQLRADILKTYGIIYRETGDSIGAEIALGEAIRLAEEVGLPIIAADAYRELALLHRQEDRNREALLALNAAHRYFSGLQAKLQQADIESRLSQLEGDFLSIVAKWGESIEAKDRYTSGHCSRVAEYACRIAESANIPPLHLPWFRMGAFLHDVGKMEVPEEILNKPGRLTDEERRIIEMHTVVGDELLASIQFPWDIRPMVRSHHERWDGRGYPDGLTGEEIPLHARILRIADVFDALTTNRSYREPLTPDEAFQIMEQDEGGFDPTLFEIFRSIKDELWESTRELASGE